MACQYDDPRKAVDALIAEANARWMREEQVIDDTTVIVALLDVPADAVAGGSVNPAAVTVGARVASGSVGVGAGPGPSPSR